MFRLKNQRAKLTSVNPRAELHGEETNLACDLKFTLTTGNKKLDEFDPGLRHALFEPARDDDDYQPDLAEQATDHGDDHRHP